MESILMLELWLLFDCFCLEPISLSPTSEDISRKNEKTGLKRIKQEMEK